MFPRGPRFEPIKVSDVPGPNSYNLVADSQLEDYKRGAFLEKADRFSKEKESEAHGPGAYDVEPKKKAMKLSGLQTKPQTNSQNLGDRYAILQRKVEDLERVHNDGKKAHHAEVERLKLELTRYQKSNAEQTDRQEKQKKQKDLLDTRIQDLKKAAATDQAEIKDLRVKLRMSEHERTQLATKQGEAGELKKSLQLLESKRKDELRDRDRRIAELEKALAWEKKRREEAEAKSQDIKGKGDEELHAARSTAQKLEAAIASAHAEAKEARNALASLQEAAGGQEADLYAQLDHHRSLVALIAEEYGRLARSTVPAATHTILQHQLGASQLQLLRWERRLDFSKDQLEEVVSMARTANEQNAFLSEKLQDLELEIDFYRSVAMDTTLVPSNDPSAPFRSAIQSIEAERIASQNEVQSLDTRTAQLSAEFYRLTCEQLMFEYAMADNLLKHEQQVSQQHSTSLSSALASLETSSARLKSVQEEKAALDEQLKTATDLADSLKVSSDSMARRIAEAETQVTEAAARHEAALKKERDSVRRFAEMAQKSRMAEDALRAEIEQLTTELTDAERYQEAYCLLSDEVESLVARNQLAEEEAQKLSKFNAEIIGHNNPAQRIMYVDRIRRELAETKHKLAMLGREQEAAVAINDDLQHELDMYKSVMVPAEQKPRTTITRIIRPPLVNLTRSLNTSSPANSAASSGKTDGSAEKVGAQRIRVLESIPGDMTIEEIM
ncbi:hypothetical protein D9615_002490 [Tricholomella constricta]|uniref:Uncharacterized protein n=1 Tax=Tricholomella constricta TaxID=117010 RepID=A0A8H5HMH7_9AGAR|nr:hypothetical protein D9615_002490 [Tricholomella constricta]